MKRVRCGLPASAFLALIILSPAAAQAGDELSSTRTRLAENVAARTDRSGNGYHGLFLSEREAGQVIL